MSRQNVVPFDDHSQLGAEGRHLQASFFKYFSVGVIRSSVLPPLLLTAAGALSQAELGHGFQSLKSMLLVLLTGIVLLCSRGLKALRLPTLNYWSANARLVHLLGGTVGLVVGYFLLLIVTLR